MKLLSSTPVLVALGVCVILHVLSCLLRGRASRVLSYINIAMHIALVILSAFASLPIEEAVLVYLFSLFVYTLTSTLVTRDRARALREARETFEARENKEENV